MGMRLMLMIHEPVFLIFVLFRDDLDLHLDDMQVGLDSLKDLLQGTQYNIDSGTLSGVGSPFNLAGLDSHAVSKVVFCCFLRVKGCKTKVVQQIHLEVFLVNVNVKLNSQFVYNLALQ